MTTNWSDTRQCDYGNRFTPRERLQIFEFDASSLWDFESGLVMIARR